MADFDQFDNLDIAQPQEASEEAKERFQERLATAQKALKKLKKDESKRKKQDNHLVKIITYFLQTKGNTNLANLIADLVEKNTPSDFILAILSLVDDQSKDVILVKKSQILLKNKQPQTEKSLTTFEENIFEKISPTIKQEINLWFEHIYLIGKEETEKIMDKTLDSNLEINPNIAQLMTALLQRFLSKHQHNAEYATLYEFIQLGLKKIYETLQIEYAEQLQITESTQ